MEREAAASGSEPAPFVVGAYQVLFAVVLGSYLAHSVFGSDLYFQLALGRWIRSAVALPVEDLWTYTGARLLWLSDTWLLAVLTSLLEEAAGERGLVVLRLVLYIALALVTSLLYARETKSAFAGSFVAALVCGGLLSGVPTLPTVAGAILFALLTVTISAAPGAPRLLTLIPAAALYAALHRSHATVPLVLLSLALLATERRRQLLAGALATTVGFVISPYLGRESLFAVRTLLADLDFYLRYKLDVPSVYDFSFCFLLLLWAALSMVLSSAREKPRAELIVAGAASFLAAAAAPVIPYALILTGTALARAWRAAGETGLKEGVHALGARLSRLPPSGSLWVLVCLVIVNIVPLLRNRPDDFLMPQAAVDAFVERAPGVRLFHGSDAGGYLIHRFAGPSGQPQTLALLDFRTSYLNPAAAAAVRDAFEVRAGWEETLERYGANAVLCRTGTPLCELLEREPAWSVLYEGEPLRGAPSANIPRELAPWAIYSLNSPST